MLIKVVLKISPRGFDINKVYDDVKKKMIDANGDFYEVEEVKEIAFIKAE